MESIMPGNDPKGAAFYGQRRPAASALYFPACWHRL